MNSTLDLAFFGCLRKQLKEQLQKHFTPSGQLLMVLEARCFVVWMQKHRKPTACMGKTSEMRRGGDFFCYSQLVLFVV